MIYTHQMIYTQSRRVKLIEQLTRKIVNRKPTINFHLADKAKQKTRSHEIRRHGLVRTYEVKISHSSSTIRLPERPRILTFHYQFRFDYVQRFR